LGEYCAPPTHRYHKPALSLSETKDLLQQAVSFRETSASAVDRIAKACHDRETKLIRHLSVDDVIHDCTVQRLLTAVMFNSMAPSFKESAALALSAAMNYDWMTYDWLKCNRRFLTSETNAWKSIVLVECQMKLTNRVAELNCFREAAIRFRNAIAPHTAVMQKSNAVQQSLFKTEMSGVPSGPIDERESRRTAVCTRLTERIDILIAGAN
jgi:hypothetical protein